MRHDYKKTVFRCLSIFDIPSPFREGGLIVCSVQESWGKTGHPVLVDLAKQVPFRAGLKGIPVESADNPLVWREDM